MKEAIQNAYERMTPDEHTRDIMLQRIQMQTRTQDTPIRYLRNRYLTAAVCVVLVAALSVFTVSIFQKGNPLKPILQTSDTQIATNAGASTDKPDAPTTFTDEDFIQSAVGILQMLDMDGIAEAQSYVVHIQESGKAEIYFTEKENVACVKLDEQTGELYGISCMDWMMDGTACTAYAEVETLAKQYYEMLPLPQGYVLTEDYEFNEQWWDFRFEREVLKGIYSIYESVTIGINPQTGRLRQCQVQSVPLSDDGSGNTPLTEQEAETLARAKLKNPDKYQTKSCVIEVVQQEWNDDFTRLSWRITFENPNSEYPDIVTIYVDYYTGKILIESSTQ